MDTTLAQYANLSLYSAMAVLTLSMIGYAIYLAGLVPARVDSRWVVRSAREEVLVAAGGEPTAFEPNAATTDAAVDAPERARRAAGIAQSLAVLGTVLLVAGVALRGASVHRWPLGNMHEFATFAAACVMSTFVVWGTRRDLRWLGLFVTGPVLLVLGLAMTVWYTAAAELLPSLKSYWLVIHVTVATIATALFGLGAAMTGLSLWQDRVESRADRSFMERLPSSRVLERLAYGMHIIAFPLWTFTLIAGAIWARQAWGSYWNWDPKEVWTFVIWVVYAAYLHARATSGWSRAQASWIALAGFACILVNYGVVNVWFVSQHSYSGL
jgi:cytochrome c-type biogenesis protein CcsB